MKESSGLCVENQGYKRETGVDVNEVVESGGKREVVMERQTDRQVGKLETDRDREERTES